jgi:hypothetical protein
MQAARNVILIRPTGFAHDPQTAGSNLFQQELVDLDVKRLAAEDLDALLDALRNCGIGITVLDPVDPSAPNGVFPNNWFSTHADGQLVIYPMFTPSRRAERDPLLNEKLRSEGSVVRSVVDLAFLENKEQFLEGTGSLVLDRVNKLAFACLSPRTSEAALRFWCDRMGYTAVPFTATMDGKLYGQPVYHTNVVMSIGEEFAVVCLDAIPYPAERQEIREELEKAGKEVITIRLEQMHSFVGNLLQLRGRSLDHSTGDDRFLLLSETAFSTLIPEQRLALQKHGQLVPVAVPTIETVGGGSVRCMIAEDFLR